MDQIKQQLEQLGGTGHLWRKLTIAYDAYNRFMLAEKASGLVKAAANQDKLSRDLDQLETDLAQKQQQLDADRQLMTRLDQEQGAGAGKAGTGTARCLQGSGAAQGNRS